MTTPTATRREIEKNPGVAPTNQPAKSSGFSELDFLDSVAICRQYKNQNSSSEPLLLTCHLGSLRATRVWGIGCRRAS